MIIWSGNILENPLRFSYYTYTLRSTRDVRNHLLLCISTEYLFGPYTSIKNERKKISELTFFIGVYIIYLVLKSVFSIYIFQPELCTTYKKLTIVPVKYRNNFIYTKFCFHFNIVSKNTVFLISKTFQIPFRLEADILSRIRALVLIAMQVQLYIFVTYCLKVMYVVNWRDFILKVCSLSLSTKSWIYI